MLLSTTLIELDCITMCSCIILVTITYICHALGTPNEVLDSLLAVVEKQARNTTPFYFLLSQTVASSLEAITSNGGYLPHHCGALLYRIYELHVINDLLQMIGSKTDYIRALLPLLQV